MGIIKNIVVDAVTNVVEDVAQSAAVGAVVAAGAAVVGVASGVAKGAEAIGKAIKTPLGDKDARHLRKEMRYLSKKPGNVYLFIQRGGEGLVFSVYDPSENLQYCVSGEWTKDRVALTVFDADITQIGSITKSKKAPRSPVFHERKPADYLIYINDSVYATLKTKIPSNRETYVVEPFGWVIREDQHGWAYTMYDGEEEVAHISKRKGYDQPTYILDYPDQHGLCKAMLSFIIICRED